MIIRNPANPPEIKKYKKILDTENEYANLSPKTP